LISIRAAARGRAAAMYEMSGDVADAGLDGNELAVRLSAACASSRSIAERRQGQLRQADLIAFAPLRKVNNLLGDDIAQGIAEFGQAELSANVLERTRHRVNRGRLERAILQ